MKKVKKCEECGRKFGILYKRHELEDGRVLCYECLEKIENPNEEKMVGDANNEELAGENEIMDEVKAKNNKKRKVNACEICGNASLGGYWEVDGKMVCAKCEKELRQKKQIENQRYMDEKSENLLDQLNKESVDDLKTIVISEKIDNLLLQQKITVRHLRTIKNIMLFFTMLYLIGGFFMLIFISSI